MEQNLFLSKENLEEIKSILQVNLLKRGITAPIQEIKEALSRNGNNHNLEFQTAEFQTTPVMFKRVQVNNFSSSVSERLKSELDPKLEGSYIAVWVSVHFSWESFEGGSNSTKMFDIQFNVFNGDFSGVRLKEIR